MIENQFKKNTKPDIFYLQALLPTHISGYLNVMYLCSCQGTMPKCDNNNCTWQKNLYWYSSPAFDMTCTYHLLYPDNIKSGIHVRVNWDKAFFRNPHFFCLRSKQHVLRVPDFGWHLMVNSLCVFMDWYNQPISVNTNVQKQWTSWHFLDFFEMKCCHSNSQSCLKHHLFLL